MKDIKQVSLIQRVLLEVGQFKKHKLNEFLVGETDWWYSPINDIVMAMTNGEKPGPFKYAEVETNDWLWVMSTIDGNLVLEGKGGIGIEVE
ncbi:hypothetical protein CHPC974_001275 [Lactococcus phage CHPC974]|nr:hypothetical protein [Oenococcus oeni]NP_839917.1 hypothetical protein P335p26 [Lactococcus phage 4268]QGT52613.1 hypothetical protein CHPC1175_000267 [Lactococcus phage CHPC1175]QGT52904.1 hypothetical protein CHPC148_000559 [Lactococcus phage CHPC148]QGT53172.1 hypothetical protein CHPC836_000832 [Lactococcus phage CHPC836]QGT53610.1 hypothetical protein CHPC974_001275 [Lactococcus phage CHPC974]AAM83065.1 hypothetical protein [Lactococcus phage 4268]